jgi:hypothetical protein
LPTEPIGRRKRRTRQHIISERSEIYVQSCALRCGFSIERIERDYGIDLLLFTHNENGEIENGNVFIQLKASDSVKLLKDRQTIAFSLSRADLELWLREPMPYILVLYDARADTAYWLYVQAYFERKTGFDIRKAGEKITVYIEKSRLLDEDAMRKFASFKNQVLRQIQGVIRHYE